MSDGRVLVAGIGNVFFGDDGFGVEVARRLAERPRPPHVDVVDFGIRGIDLAYALLDGYDLAILVDATPRGGAPGTLYVLEPDLAHEGPARLTDTHGIEPRRVLDVARGLVLHADADAEPPMRLPVLRIVGCEPAAVLDEDDMAMGLSAPVAAAVDAAVALVESLVTEVREAARA
ncbi:MAG TPA: hydrogenase maturation protease [Terriglobales bacterium]|nr:hydrogenase maturation protease [Terriglobales bacterium]